MRIGYLGIVGDLTLSCLPSQLKHILIYLSEARGANWFAVRQAAPISIHRESTIDLGITISQHLLLLPVLANTAFCHVHTFCTCLRVLQLGNINGFRADSSGFNGSFRCIYGRTIGKVKRK